MESKENDNAHGLSEPFTFLGIRFAPLNIPFKRRLQTLVVLILMFATFVVPWIVIYLFVSLSFSTFFPIPLAYVCYRWFFDLGSPSSGSKHSNWVRNGRIWKYFSNYFPASLIKTTELSPDKNYLIGYHPHGIISYGAFCSFGTEATGFSKIFPGIKPHLMTLKTQFYCPFTREMNMSLGMCDVSEKSIRYVLDKNRRGNAAIIVVGGAEEALLAHPGMLKLTLKRRKGFVRMAIKTGAHLVPCFSFGENELFDQVDNPEGSQLRRFQEFVKRITRITPPVIYGRGVFNYSMGMLPHRHPIATIVGAPLEVQQDPNPTAEMIDRLHQEYLDALSKLFEEHKLDHGISEDKHLTFV